MTQYTRGRAKEYAAARYLRERGATLVVRAAGSRGLADLVAVFGAVVWLVSVKYTATGRWRDANWRALCVLRRPGNVWATALVFRRGCSTPEVWHA